MYIKSAVSCVMSYFTLRMYVIWCGSVNSVQAPGSGARIENTKTVESDVNINIGHRATVNPTAESAKKLDVRRAG